MQLPGSGQLSVPTNGRVQSPKVRECGGKGETVEHLGDARPCLVSLPLVSPVPCGQGVLESIRDGLRLNGQLQVKVLEGYQKKEVSPVLPSVGRALHSVSAPVSRQQTRISQQEVKNLSSFRFQVLPISLWFHSESGHDMTWFNRMATMHRNDTENIFCEICITVL